jgi:hypothetical protein
MLDWLHSDVGIHEQAPIDNQNESKHRRQLDAGHQRNQGKGVSNDERHNQCRCEDESAAFQA